MIKAENPILIEDDCMTFDYVRSKFKGEENFKNPKKIKEWFERFNKTIHSTFFFKDEYNRKHERSTFGNVYDFLNSKYFMDLEKLLNPKEIRIAIKEVWILSAFSKVNTSRFHLKIDNFGTGTKESFLNKEYINKFEIMCVNFEYASNYLYINFEIADTRLNDLYIQYFELKKKLKSLDFRFSPDRNFDRLFCKSLGGIIRDCNHDYDIYDDNYVTKLLYCVNKQTLS